MIRALLLTGGIHGFGRVHMLDCYMVVVSSQFCKKNFLRRPFSFSSLKLGAKEGGSISPKRDRYKWNFAAKIRRI